MNSIRSIKELNKRELEAGISPEGSWHADYRDTAYIYIGGLSFDLSEGDIITICSQFGEPVWIKLARDKDTGKSRGFAWLKYEDQRSTDLAVDNLGGATVMGRMLRVDHARYKKRDDEEDEGDNTIGFGKAAEAEEEEDEEEGDSGRRKGKKRRTEEDSEDDRPVLKEEQELMQIIRDHDDDDPMKEYMVSQKKEEVEKAIKAWSTLR